MTRQIDVLGWSMVFLCFCFGVFLLSAAYFIVTGAAFVCP